MKINKIETSNSSLNIDKVNEIFTKLVDVYQEAKPTIGEIIITLSNLTYTLGASIGGFQDKGPSFEELGKIYYSDPSRIDVALMLQGFTMNSWYESLLKNNSSEIESYLLSLLDIAPVKPEDIPKGIYSQEEITNTIKTLLAQGKIKFDSEWKLTRGE